jgi:hypothetical protein
VVFVDWPNICSGSSGVMVGHDRLTSEPELFGLRLLLLLHDLSAGMSPGSGGVTVVAACSCWSTVKSDLTTSLPVVVCACLVGVMAPSVLLLLLLLLLSLLPLAPTLLHPPAKSSILPSGEGEKDSILFLHVVVVIVSAAVVVFVDSTSLNIGGNNPPGIAYADMMRKNREKDSQFSFRVSAMKDFRSTAQYNLLQQCGNASIVRT